MTPSTRLRPDRRLLANAAPCTRDHLPAVSLHRPEGPARVRLWRRLSAGLLLSLGLAACGGPSIQQYEGESPRLDLIEYFSGRSEAWGLVQERNGTALRRFHVVIDGRQDGERLILDEHFRYNNGEIQRRVWVFTPDGPQRWRGQADDVAGEARAELAGNALHLRYDLRVPIDGRNWTFAMDDWMFLIDADTLVNRTSMRKFGLEVGEVTLFFRKAPRPFREPHS